VSRPLLLLPPSKGKREGGDGPAYGRTLRDGHPLAEARRTVLDALRATVPSMADSSLRRLAGVARRDLAVARRALVELHEAPTSPAARRYTGIVHRNAGWSGRPEGAGVDVRVVSPLLGLAAADDPVPWYRLELATLPPLGGLASWWRVRLADHLDDVAAGRRVWDLLPGEHARVWDPAVRARLDVIDLRFARPDGRAANAARAKVCKGRLAAAVLAEPGLDPATMVAEVDPGPGWSLALEDATITATFAG
jgi:cytoplasmic iron level regulating protein YaaA (DUF328/UPF0246 family)